jgi:RHS repeat-associated protein
VLVVQWDDIFTRTLTYGATGNITGDDFGTGRVFGFAYNQDNRLSQATVAGAYPYHYDFRGRRVFKQQPNFMYFHYDRESHLIAESLFGGFEWHEYIWLDDLPLAFITLSAIDYIHTDHLGAPQKMTDGSQTIVWDGAGSDPFMLGQLPALPPMNLRFPGQYFDSETGLHHNGLRDYDPTLGRYIESDPIGLGGGINTYAYAGSNPLTNIDFFGLDVTMTCRPLDNAGSKIFGWPKHCSDFVWHWETDPCTGVKHKVIDAQFSLPGGGTAPTKDPTNSTYVDDTNAFNNPGGNNTRIWMI